MAAPCPKCHARRIINENKLIELNIDKGMANGDTIHMEKEGEQVIDLARGDLIFKVIQKQHKIYKRVGNDLFMDL